MLVVDASVAVKVLTQEPGSAAAVALLAGEDDVLAPSLLLLEVASALSKKVRYHGLPVAMALASHRALPQFITAFAPTEDLLEAGFALSIELKHAMQDCVYLALAIERECRLVTADLKFAASVDHAGRGTQMLVLDGAS